MVRNLLSTSGKHFYIQHSEIIAVGSVNSLVHLDIPICFMDRFVMNKGRTAALGNIQPTVIKSSPVRRTT